MAKIEPSPLDKAEAKLKMVEEQLRYANQRHEKLCYEFNALKREVDIHRMYAAILERRYP